MQANTIRFLSDKRREESLDEAAILLYMILSRSTLAMASLPQFTWSLL